MGKQKAVRNIFRAFSLLLVAIFYPGCQKKVPVFIITGQNATRTEMLTANHLKKDLELKTGREAKIIHEKENGREADIEIVIGTPKTNAYLSGLIENRSIILSEDFPGKRGGIMAKANISGKGECIILAGSDVQGMQYAVYEYSNKVLGIDHLAYWTGAKPERDPHHDLFGFNNTVLAAPEVPILCYFENDVDELANLKEPLLEYDWESYTEMINALVRLKYNAIHLFDMLGRPEFFLRDSYKKIRPDYDVRISYIDSLINYAHDMGMMVAIDFSLGYKVRPMDQEKADCWTNNKQEWIATWKYYFEETPFAKADIITLRPRNQVWDWPYKSSCGENNVDVFNEVFAELDKVIQQYKPGAIKVATCYTDGMEMFNNGFNPPKDWIIAWSDDGWGGFEYFPDSTKGYRFGTYMHAGFWLNHTVHDPYPEKIDTIMKMMKDNYGAVAYYEINGQQFRPFLLNIEAFAHIAENPHGFDGEGFYKVWTERYFGEASPYAINAMKMLHAAHFGNKGYINRLSETRAAIAYLRESPSNLSGGNSNSYQRVAALFEEVDQRKEILEEALRLALDGAERVKNNPGFYHDYIVLPIYLYHDLLEFESHLHQMAKQKHAYESSGKVAHLNKLHSMVPEARGKLQGIMDRRKQGDKSTKWAGWYDVSKRRPNGGFPTMEMVGEIENNVGGMISAYKQSLDKVAASEYHKSQ
jgi:hypothetical protein